MKTRTLGRTGLKVSEIGLGTEYLHGQPRSTVVAVVQEAIDRGVNYIDLVFAFPEYRDNLGAALKGRRDRVILAGHLGPAETDGQYRKTRDTKECRALFEDLLRRLNTDYIDVVLLQFVDEEEDYRQVMAPDGLLGLALELQREGKAGYIGLSGHEIPVSRKAVESGEIDVLMHPINLAWDAKPGRHDLFQLCANRDVGLVSMKPFGGGELLRPREKPAAGGPMAALTPVQCLSYVLSQVGVSTVVPGVKDLQELAATIAYLSATETERDYTGVIGAYRDDLEGRCVYCNHCLPCPVGINVGETMRLVAAAGQGVTEAIRERYEALPAVPSECLECGECVARCPFGVDVIAGMREAVATFG